MHQESAYASIRANFAPAVIVIWMWMMKAIYRERKNTAQETQQRQEHKLPPLIQDLPVNSLRLHSAYTQIQMQ
jgi:hypothetical protein